MAVYTNINRNNKKEKRVNYKVSNTRKFGIVALVIASVGSVALFTNFLTFLRIFLMGSFGVFAYAIFSSLFIVAKHLISGKTYHFEAKHMLLFSLAIISFLSILQMAFLGSGTAVNFLEYLKDVYNLQTSVGGITIAIITYPLLKILNPVGAYIFYIIIFAVSLAFLIDYFLEQNTFQKKSRGYVNFKEQIKKNSDTQPLFIEEKPKKRLSLFSKLFLKKQEENTLVLNTQVTSQYNENNTFFENQKQNRYIEKEEAPVISSTLTNKPFQAIFESEDTRRPPKILHTNYNETLPIRKTSQDDDARRKNLEFLRSTLPNTPKQNAILGTNVKNPNEQFTTSFMKQKINERQTVFKEEYGIEDVSVKFEEDLKSITNNNLNKEEVIIKSEEQEVKTTTIEDLFKKAEPSLKTSRIPNFEQIKLNEVKESEIIKPRYTKPSRYIRPPFELLNTISTNIEDYGEEYLENSQKLEKVLNDFRVQAKVIAVTRGPAVTRYELQMPAGVSVKKILQHSEDIAMTLASNGSIRIEAPIPGKNAVGIEVPNNKIATIALKDIIDSKEFAKNRSPLTFALGKDIAGNVKVCDLARMPHLLVAGATGSGKSVCLHSLIISLLYKTSPEELRFILIDPKRVEFYAYNGLPHLMLPEVISEPEKAINAFNWAIEEMEKRFTLFQKAHAKNLAEYNMQQEVVDGIKPKLPMIVIIVDELADLMLTNKREVEDKIMRLAAKARAAGIHLVLATQRPSVDVITGTIKANLPSRIALSVTSIADSKTILDGGGADKLLGKGDMLYAPIDYPEPRRIQGAFVSNEEVRSIVDFIINNNKSYFDEEISTFINKKVNAGGSGIMMGETREVEIDPLLPQALRLFIESGQASTSMLQRKFAIGFSRAGRIVDQMADLKYISPSDGSKARNVYITMEKFKQIYGDE